MRNNHIIPIFLLILALLAGGGCKDDIYQIDGPVQPSLTAHYIYSSVSDIYAGSEGFNESFPVYSLNSPWKFLNSSEWITISPMSGSETTSVNFNIAENLSAVSPRSAILSLRSDDPDWDYDKAISVSQAAAPPYFLVDISELDFPGTSDSRKIYYETNTQFLITTQDSWIHTSYNEEESSITVTVDPNPNNSKRIGNIRVDYGGTTEGNFADYGYLYIYQAPTTIIGSESYLNYDNIAAAYTISLDAEIAWEGIASDNWIQVSPDSGEAGTTEVTIEVAPNTSVNSRSGYVNFYSAQVLKWTVEIRQDGLFIKPLLNSLSFPAGESTLDLELSSNTAWAIESLPAWLSITPTEGIGSATLSVTSEENPSTWSRYGEIVIYQPGVNLYASVGVSQSGAHLSTNQSYFEYGASGGSLTFDIKTSGSWSAFTSDDWISLSPSSGKGDTEVTITAEENMTSESRSGTVTFNYADTSLSVEIFQLGKYLTISNQTFNFQSKGGVHILELSTNDSWKAHFEGNPDWLSISNDSGTGDSVIEITAADNASVNTRSATLIIDNNSGQDIRILISQDPRYLRTSSQSIILFADGGDSQVVEISTDGTYSLTTEGDWFTLHRLEGDSFYISASENPGKVARRGKIIIALTDLTTGSLTLEMSVIQAGEGCTFILNPFPTTDADWDIHTAGSLGVKITGYSVEKDWAPKAATGLTVKVTGFSSDEDWNRNEKFNCNVKISQYGFTVDWNGIPSGSAIFSNSGFSPDSEWTSAPASGVSNIGNSPFSPDSEWTSTPDSDNSNIGNSPFSPDSDWNDDAKSNTSLKITNFSQEENWSD